MSDDIVRSRCRSAVLADPRAYGNCNLVDLCLSEVFGSVNGTGTKRLAAYRVREGSSGGP